MNRFIRRVSGVVAFGACMLVGATAAPTTQQPYFPCNAPCTGTVSITPANGICTYGGGPCGSIGIRVTVVTTSGQCRPTAGACAGLCTFAVTLDYDNSFSCACTTVSGTECGNSFSFNCLPACTTTPVPCFLQTNTDSVQCGGACNFSYTVTDTGSNGSCNVSGTLTCGTTACP